MSLIKCIECNNVVSAEANVCPHCGINLHGISDTVNIEGTVKIDKSEEIKNWIILAHRAKEEMNAIEGAKYYQLISKEEPSNIEAAFYSVYFNSMQTNAQNAKVDIQNLKKRTLSTLSIIKEQNMECSMKHFIEELGEKICYFCAVKYTHLQQEMNPLINRSNTFYFKEIVELLQLLAYDTGDKIESLFGKQNHSGTICKIFKDGVFAYIRMTTDCNSLPSSNTRELKQKAKYYAEKIKMYDKKYKSPIKWYM